MCKDYATSFNTQTYQTENSNLQGWNEESHRLSAISWAHTLETHCKELNGTTADMWHTALQNRREDHIPHAPRTLCSLAHLLLLVEPQKDETEDKLCVNPPNRNNAMHQGKHCFQIKEHLFCAPLVVRTYSAPSAYSALGRGFRA